MQIGEWLRRSRTLPHAFVKIALKDRDREAGEFQGLRGEHLRRDFVSLGDTLGDEQRMVGLGYVVFVPVWFGEKRSLISMS